jgi:hypothetical protein
VANTLAVSSPDTTQGAEAADGPWLLDTSVFYACGSPQSRERLKQAAAGQLLVTSASTPIEILSGARETDFDKRKSAIRALSELCRGDAILPDSDAVVARAFSQPSTPLDIDGLHKAIDAALHANSVADLEAALPDALRAGSNAPSLQRMREWDKVTAQNFVNEMGNTYARVDPAYREVAKEAGLQGHDAATAARLMRAVAVTVDPIARMATLVALACRAGLISDADLQAALASETAAPSLTELVKQAGEKYDGTLDGFIETYVHYHGYLAATGRATGVNDCLDLEPFMHIGKAAKIYASGETMWLRIAELASPGSSRNIREIARQG